MLALESKIKLLLQGQSMTQKELCNRIDMSEQNLRQIFNRDSIETKHLFKIASALGVPVTYFFEETGTAPAGVLKTAPQTADFQKQIIALQAEVSALKSKIIELLEQKKT